MIEGHCDPRFGRVARAFEQNFKEHDELGAAVAITLGGELVVDLWGGCLDAARTRPWREDSIVNVWSLGKAVSAIALLQLVDADRVGLDTPVSAYWPEFAQAGKAALPVKYLLTHQAGLPAVAKPLPPGANLTDWDGMCTALAEQSPWWQPGTRFGYHTNTFGFLVGEVVRRVTGRRLREHVAERIAKPLGADFYIGFGPEHDHRVAAWQHYVPKPDDENLRPWLSVDPDKVEGLALARILAYRNPPPLEGADVNSRLWRAAEYPSTNPHANARALARIFGALTCGEALLSRPMVERANTIEADGEDCVLGRPNRFGLGFQLTNPGVRPLGPNPRAFGHYGNGAVVGFADPAPELGFGYVCNRAGRSWRDPRNIALIDAMYESLS